MPPKAPKAKARSGSTSRGQKTPAPKAPVAQVAKLAVSKAEANDAECCVAPVDAPTSIESARELLKALTQADFDGLVASTDLAEQLPVRLALELVGDKDLSWTNAQKSLKAGAEFVKEILEMDGGDFITRKGVERMDALGKLSLQELISKNKAAYVLAAYISFCICSAKERLGLNGSTTAAEAPPDYPPPDWPLKVPFSELPTRIAEAGLFRKTALIVCNGHAREVDTFLCYRAYVQIDAKWVMGETLIRKTMTIEDMREALRERVVAAMKNGLPLHIAMSNSAVAFKDKFCADGKFPLVLFSYGAFDDTSIPENEREYKKLIRQSDLEEWVGAFPGRVKDGFHIVITTDFDIESSKEHLTSALPHFEDMALIEIDPSSFAE